MRDHLRDALSADPTAAHRFLSGLGPVEAIADQTSTEAAPSVPFVPFALALAALVTAALHLRSPGASRDLCGAAITVSTLTVLIGVLASGLLVSATSTVITPSPAVTSSPLTTG